MKKIFILLLVFVLLNCFYAFAQDKETEVQADSDKVASYNADNYRDPFMPQIKKEEKKKEADSSAAASQSAPPEFNVQGMVWRSDNPQAIIDGQILRIGDEIKDARVIDISKDGVKFLFRGKIITAKPKVAFERK